MANHRFQVGDKINLTPNVFSPSEAQGPCTVTRLLPNDAPDREYRVQYGSGGQERVVRESEMRLRDGSGRGREAPPA